MRYLFVGGLMLVLGGSPAVVRADDAPEPFKSLAGSWVRPSRTNDGKLDTNSPLTAISMGRTEVLPELRFVDDLVSVLGDRRSATHTEIRKKFRGLPEHWSLVVGAGPVCGSVGPTCFASHRVTP